MKSKIISLLISFNAFGQVPKGYVSQKHDLSCWASSIANATFRLGKEPILNEEEVLKALDIQNQNVKPIELEFKTIAQKVKKIINKPIRITQKKVSSKYLENYFISSEKNPMLYFYKFFGDKGHVVMIDTMVQFPNWVNTHKFLRVIDPWPKNRGQVRYTNYYRINMHPSANNGKIMLFFEEKQKHIIEKVPWGDTLNFSKIPYFVDTLPSKTINNYIQKIQDYASKNLIDKRFLNETNLFYQDLKLIDSFPIKPIDINQGILPVNEIMYLYGDSNTKEIKTAITLAFFKSGAIDYFMISDIQNATYINEFIKINKTENQKFNISEAAIDFKTGELYFKDRASKVTVWINAKYDNLIKKWILNSKQ